MKLALTGKLIWIGNNYANESPRASILLSEGDEDEIDKSLEIDLDEKDAVELAHHLYEDVRICIEIPSRPKIVE